MSGCVWFCFLLILITHVYHNARFKKRKALSTHITGRTKSPYTSDDTQPDVLWQSIRRRSSRKLYLSNTRHYEAEWHNAQWSRVRRARWLQEYCTVCLRRQKPKLKNLGLKSVSKPLRECGDMLKGIKLFGKHPHPAVFGNTLNHLPKPSQAKPSQAKPSQAKPSQSSN